MSNPYLNHLTNYGGTLGSVTGQIKNIASNPIIKNTGRALPFVSAGFDAYGDYNQGRANGEGGARAATGSALAGAADATFWTGVKTLNPLLMAGGVALDGAGWLADRGFEAFTDDDGLDRNSQQYRTLKQWESDKARTNYNANPTEANKQDYLQKSAEATGTVYQPTANQAQDILAQYGPISKVFGLEDLANPNSAINKAWEEKGQRGAIFNEKQASRIKREELRNSMIGAAFDHRNNMAAKNVDAYWNDLNSSRNFIANLWG